MVKKHSNLFIIMFAIVCFILSENLTCENIQMFAAKKTSEILCYGSIAWMFSGFIYKTVRNGFLRLLFLFVFGVTIYAMPTYVKILVWCCETSKLSIITEMSVANYIFLNKTFGTCIIRTLFWTIFFAIIYFLRYVRSKVECYTEY